MGEVTGRGRRRRWLAGSGTVVLLVVASAGCGQGTPTDVATGASSGPGGVIDDGADDRFRFTTTTEVGEGDDRRAVAPPVTGLVDRRRTQIRVDISSRVAPGELPGIEPGDLAVEALLDADRLYLRAPFVATAAERLEQAEAEATAAADAATATVDAATTTGVRTPGYELGGDEWVAVDIEALGTTRARDAAGRLAGIQGLEPDVFTELAATGDPRSEALGASEVDGVAVEGVRTEVDLLRALRAMGFSVEELAGLTEALPARTVPLEVWTDDDHLVRRVVVGLGWAPLADDAAADGELSPALVDLATAGMTTRIEMTGYGDQAIRVGAPDDALDMTAAYRADRPQGGVDVLTSAWLTGLKVDLAAIQIELVRIVALQEPGLDLSDWGGLAGTDQLLADAERFDAETQALLDSEGPPPVDPDQLAADTDALLAESEQLMAEAEALQAETDAVLAEGDQLLAETEEVLARSDEVLAGTP